MPEEFSTPEERLLKLIKGERKTGEKHREEDTHPPVIGAATKTGVKPERAEKRIKPTARSGENRYKLVNIILISVIGISCIILATDLLHRDEGAYTGKPAAAGGDVVKERPAFELAGKVPLKEAAQDTGTDMADLSSRNLFKSPASPASASASVLPAVSVGTKSLTLKGIIAGDRLQAIIEDETSKKSYFVYKGDSISNFSVEDIQEDRVILKVNGEVIELTL